MSDNSSTRDFGTQTAEIAVLLQSGDIEQAVRTSGELLAESDNRLRTLRNEQQPLDEAIQQFVEAAILHVHALRLAHAVNDAFSCAIGALLTVEIYGLADVVEPSRKLRLYSFALTSAIDSFDRMTETGDPSQEDHRGYILSYLASLLYHYYKETAAVTPDDSSLPEAYNFLKAIQSSGAIQTPTIKLGAKDVDPASP
ncbi:MAG: hypothetical protein K2J10_00775, partial [Muribaculaceae bacterium]|nr:hypothetical protein [Muribaculaceae bacterium]